MKHSLSQRARERGSSPAVAGFEEGYEMLKRFVDLSLKFSLLVGAYALATPVLAQNIGKQAKRSEPDTIVVTASRREQSLMDVTRSVAVIGQDLIKAQTVKDVAELLRDVPGVNVLEGATPGLRRISIRGEGQARNTILIDGQEVSDHSTYGSLFMVNPADIERIEVVKGPSSVLHGSKAIGGVVNIITKKGSKKPVEISLGAGYDSSTDGYNTNISAAGGAGNMDYRLSFTRSDHGDRRTADGKLAPTSISNGSTFENASASAQIGYRHENHAIRLVVDKINMDTDAYIDPNELAAADSVGLSKFILDLQKRNRTKFGVFYDGEDISEQVRKIHLDAYYQEIERETDVEYRIATPSRAIFPRGSVLDTKNHTSGEQLAFGVNAQADLTLLENHLTILGFQYVKDSIKRNERRNGSRATAIFRPPSFTYTVLPFPRPRIVNDNFDKQASLTTFSAFLQDEWDVTGDFSVTAGARYFHINSELSKTNQPGYAPFNSSDNAVIGSVGVNYTGIEDLALRANISQGYVYPTLLQNMLGSVFSPGEIIEANPALNPERSVNYEVGARYDNGGALIDAAAFYSVATDYIDFVSCSSPRITCNPSASSKYANIDAATTYGLEISGQYWLEDLGLTPYFSATAMIRTFENDGMKTKNTDIPSLTGRFGIKKDWRLYEDVDFMADIHVRGATKRKKGAIERDAFFTTNIAASMAYDIGNGRVLRVNAAVENIFDQSYTEPLSSLKAAGQTFMISSQLTF